jgi:hypothetical protein
MLIGATGMADEAHRRLAQEVGFARYLTKPLDLNELQDFGEFSERGR